MNEEMLSDNAKRPEVITEPSGLQYEILESAPKFNEPCKLIDRCMANFTMSLLDGSEWKVVESSEKLRKPVALVPDKSNPGLKEALLKMKEGDRWKIWLPSEIAYGQKGFNSSHARVAPGAAVFYEIELLEIKIELTTLMWWKEFLMNNQLLLVFAVYFFWKIVPQLKELFWDEEAEFIDGVEWLPTRKAAGLKKNATVFLDVEMGEEKGRIELELFTEKYPKTAENFRALCTGEKGDGKSGKPLCYKGTSLHRVITDFMAQGGDVTNNDGSGGESIYGEKFDDEWENGFIKLDEAGILAMANSGKNTNMSQFFITVVPCNHLNKKNVGFGKVIAGMDFFEKIVAEVGSSTGKTSKKVVIVDCGEVGKAQGSKKDN
eukprot:CAMPEP_0197663750 /NCGR_PEP_ID=MMETSP1338-20131121/58217_1 /TAXON_ID=43686 ORGANISM="Pelagodinium beii, Strain RCC1491" /NCGR_SAMPLE_ID=MMETSP1338 /ASSEMBLY_ACC=CAM_ASM_000754 /LENGTH=375 /DNA_ID=CAMNT_0043242241 /DNA_START=105 /DNA_END=1232 /DNA_ORIENTATION=-